MPSEFRTQKFSTEYNENIEYLTEVGNMDSKNIKIRSFRQEDLPAIEEIVRKIWDIGLDYEREKRYGFLVGGKSWQDRKSESIKREILSNPQHWYVTEIEGKVIGFCSYFANEETKIGIVGQNGIDPEYAGIIFLQKSHLDYIPTLKENKILSGMYFSSEYIPILQFSRLP